MSAFKQIQDQLRVAIREGNEEQATMLAQRAVEMGIDPSLIFDECITPVLARAGDQFARLEIFLPEVLLAADAAKAIFKVLEPVIQADEAVSVSLGKVIIVTVSGDVHEIGKNIVGIMLEVNGFSVKDLGRDVPVSAFLDTARDYQADIIAMSSLLTTSMPYIRDLVNLIKDTGENKRFKTLIGGGPVTSEWAAAIGADGYGKDATEAVKVAKQMVGA
jgi:methanogenic corrinoid protein MtbC1